MSSNPSSDLTPEEILAGLDTVESSFQEILENTSEPARNQLQILQILLPNLRRLIQNDTHLRETATRGRKVLSQTKTILSGLGTSTEAAVEEIFTILQSIVYGYPKGVELQLSPREVREQLMEAMNALQFQDIVTQQLAAISALLADLDANLEPLSGDIGNTADIQTEGAFDPNARFDREESNQDDIDSWIQGADAQDDPEKK